MDGLARRDALRTRLRDGRGPRATRALLAVALALLAAWPCRPAAGATVPASADSALALAAADAPPPAGGTAVLTVRRVPSPRYRARAAFAARALAPPPPVAVDDLRAQVTHRREGTGPVTDWLLAAREDRRGAGTFELSLAGRERPGAPELDEARLGAAIGGWSAALGDLAVSTLRATGPLMRLRGASLGRLAGRLPWRAHAGVSASSPGSRAAPVALAGAGADAIPLGRLQASAGAFAFGRWRDVAVASLDSVPGELASGAGGGAALELSARPGSSFLAFGLGAQLHDLDGTQAISALQRVEWRLVTPRVAISLIEARGTRGWRSLASDRLSSGATRDDRLAARWRFRRWRAETHATAAASSGDATLTALRSLRLGGSANLGQSSWFAGGDLEWRERESGTPGTAERRLALQTGRFDHAASTLLRLERSGDGRAEGATTALSGQTSIRLPGDLRALVEPRVNWRAGNLLRSDLGLGLTWTPAGSGLRIRAAVALAGPQDGPAGRTVREASVSLQFAPRGRDRCEIEVRRLEGRDGLEVSSSYDLQGQRYGRVPRNGPSDAWTGTVRVAVVAAGDSAGVADALVSLDGHRFAFTGEDGTAEFSDVEPGVHVVGIEERSLRGGLRATQNTQVFVTVERDRPAESVTIEVARPTRTVRF